MAYHCFKCNHPQSDGKCGRSESCPKCGADLHVCRNCRHYDERAYNACREPQAERVLEKERSNFCDYFSFTEGAREKKEDEKQKHLKALDDLFK